MINNVEPRVGNGGLLAIIASLLAVVVVFGVLLAQIFVPGAATTPAPTARSVFSGQFGINTAICPGASTTVAGGTCSVSVTPQAGRFHAILTWDTGATLTLGIVDDAGRSPVPEQSGSVGQLEIDIPHLAAGSYVIQVTDSAQIGPINFQLGVTQAP